jgi:type I restriction enzyme S subunit
LIDSPNTISEATARRLRAFIFPIQTIVFAKVGAALRLNRRRILVRPSCIDNNMMGFIARHCDHVWAFYWLSGLDLGEIANPGAVPSVNEYQMRNTPVALPPDPEQRAIVLFLDRETTRIDACVGKVRAAIKRLKEMRTALISSAVTGKIDVREEAP